jgi:very-short-patch-repair endonuclease
MFFYARKRRRFRRSAPAKFKKAVEMRNNPTDAEAKMYKILYSEVVPKYPKHIFYRQSVQFGYILDFYCPTLRLGLEVDGNIHDTQKKYDTRRDNALARHGIHVFRFSNENVLYNSQTVAADLCQIIDARSRHRGFITTTNYPITSTQESTTATTLQTKKACFIATAAYGTPMAKEINILRRYRDLKLNPNLIGRHLVTLYYNTSPPFAKVIARNKKMRAVVRLILKPIINIFE